MIDIFDGQNADQAIAELKAIGVVKIDTDRLRQVGRGGLGQQADTSQLCGACARGKVAIGSNGDVWPCVFARWMPVGNVRETVSHTVRLGITLIPRGAGPAATRMTSDFC